MKFLQWLPNFLVLKFQRKQKFELTKLPFLAFKEVIDCMEISEKIKLSLTSMKMEKAVMFATRKFRGLNLHIRENLAYITFTGQNLLIYSGKKVRKSEQKSRFEIMTSRDYPKWVNKFSSPLDNIVTLFNRLQKFSKLSNLVIYLDGRYVKDYISFEDVFKIPIIRKFDQITISGGEIGPKYMDMVMELANESKNLVLIGVKISMNYWNENAFIFRKIRYSDSRWVKIHHLFSLKNSTTVELSRCYLSFSEINQLLKYWIINDHNMFEVMDFWLSQNMDTVEIEDLEVKFNLENLLDGITVFRHQNSCYYIKSRSENSEKRGILCVEWIPKKQLLKLTTLESDGIENFTFSYF